jgi:hypothetical protein
VLILEYRWFNGVSYFSFIFDVKLSKVKVIKRTTEIGALFDKGRLRNFSSIFVEKRTILLAACI